MRRELNALTVLGLAGGLCAIAWTQNPQRPTGPPAPIRVNTHPLPKTDSKIQDNPKATMHFQTNIGSFKCLHGVGRFEMSFKGTVLLSHYEGAAPVFTGKVRKEYEDHTRKVYFGTGKMILEGQWRAIQWFGRDMKGTWVGGGLIRFVGEFDKNLNTGTFYYDNPKDIHYWPTSIQLVELPERHFGGNVEPMERPKTKQPASK